MWLPDDRLAIHAWILVRHEWHDCGERTEDCTDYSNERAYAYEAVTCFNRRARDIAAREFMSPSGGAVGGDSAGLFFRRTD